MPHPAAGSSRPSGIRSISGRPRPGSWRRIAESWPRAPRRHGSQGKGGALTWAAESSVHPGCVRPAARVISRGEGGREGGCADGWAGGPGDRDACGTGGAGEAGSRVVEGVLGPGHLCADVAALLMSFSPRVCGTAARLPPARRSRSRWRTTLSGSRSPTGAGQGCRNRDPLAATRKTAGGSTSLPALQRDGDGEGGTGGP